jgi:hypothetical protein
MTMTIAAVAAALILPRGGAAKAQAAAGYEKEPVFNAKDLAASELLQAPEKVAFLSGRMSPLAQRNLTSRGWTINETYTTAAER